MRPAFRSTVIDGLRDAGRVRDGDDPAAAGGRGARSELRAAGADRANRRAAADALRAAVAAGGFGVTLLDGVTGSGKTEVYFEAVAAALDSGKQVLILLPEIALTQAFLERFQDRFGAKPAEWHSDVPPRMRERVWRQVAEGRVRVVAGARSALFLPFRELGLIVVDEEHDPAYKQEDRVFYNARDMAVVRARIGGFPVVLASATPSIESRVNAEQGRYARVALPARFADAAMPDHRARSTCAARRRRAAASCRPCCSAICSKTLRARRAVAAVPQPARLCAADALPRLRPPLPVPGLLELAGRASLSRPARLPPLRPSREPPRGLSGMRHARPSGRLRPGRRAHRRRGRRAFSRRAHHRAVLRHAGRRQAAAARARGDRQGRGRHRHRHAARRQGASTFPT